MVKSVLLYIHVYLGHKNYYSTQRGLEVVLLPELRMGAALCHVVFLFLFLLIPIPEIRGSHQS